MLGFEARPKMQEVPAEQVRLNLEQAAQTLKTLKKVQAAADAAEARTRAAAKPSDAWTEGAPTEAQAAATLAKLRGKKALTTEERVEIAGHIERLENFIRSTNERAERFGEQAGVDPKATASAPPETTGAGAAAASAIPTAPPTLASIGTNWKKEAKNLLVQNHAYLEEAAPNSWRAARGVGAHRAQATLATNAFAVQMDRAAKGTPWEIPADAAPGAPGAPAPQAYQVIFDVLQESRLRGVAEKYREIADALPQTNRIEFHKQWEGWLRDAVDSIDKVQGSNIKEKVVDFLIKGEPEAAQNYLAHFFDGVSKRVFETGLQEKYGKSFDQLIQDPFVQQGIQSYKQTVEPVFRRAHAQNDGFFSDKLGPLKTYFPLIRQDEAFVRAPRPGIGGYDQDLMPQNPTNRFATGLVSEGNGGYRATVESIRGRLSSSVQKNGIAGLVDQLIEDGIAVTVEPGKETGFVEILGQPVALSDLVGVQARPAMLVRPEHGGTPKTIPGQTIYMPKTIAKELEPIFSPPKPRGNKVMGPDGEPIVNYNNVFDRIAHQALTVALFGPADAVFHTSNILGGLAASTKNVGGGVISRAIQLAPFGKKIATITKLVDQARTFDPFEGKDLADLQRMAQLGYVPNRYGSSTISGELGRTLGLEVVGNPRQSHGAGNKLGVFEPFLFGPKGLDIQVRLLAYRLAKEAAGGRDNTPEFTRAMEALIDYNRTSQPYLQRAMKDGPFLGLIAPFVSAGSTMLTQGVRGVVMNPPSPLGKEAAPGAKAAWWVENQMNAGLSGAVMTWAVLHHQLHGKWPWDDPDSRFMSIRLPDSIRQSPTGKLLYGDNPDSGFISMRFGNPTLMRGLKTVGATGVADTLMKGGTWDQAAEEGARDAMNSVGHVVTSGPLPGVVSGLVTGSHFYVSQLRDAKTGKFQPALGSSIPTRVGVLPNLEAHLLGGVAGLNPLVGEAASGVEKALVGGESLIPEDKGNELAKTVFDYLFAGARVPTRSTPMWMRHLGQASKVVQKRAAKEEAVGKIK
jgi:hypothetical protein